MFINFETNCAWAILIYVHSICNKQMHIYLKLNSNYQHSYIEFRNASKWIFNGNFLTGFFENESLSSWFRRFVVISMCIEYILNWQSTRYLLNARGWIHSIQFWRDICVHKYTCVYECLFIWWWICIQMFSKCWRKKRKIDKY